MTRARSLQALMARPGMLSVVLIALAAALYLPWLGHTDLVHEETRRAVIARTMMDSGEYLVPYLGDRIYLSKPPLFNWMIVATSLPGGGVTEFTVRLPSVIALALLALVMVHTAGRQLGSAARWLLGVGTLVTGELMHKAVLGNVEVAFTLFVSASLWSWFELDRRGCRGLRLWLLPGVLVAAAFLTKREPALVFYYLGIAAFLLTQGRFRDLFRPGHVAAAAVTLALIAAWLVPVILEAGPARFVDNLREQVLTRGVSPEASDYVAHIASYPFELLVAALPLSVLLIPLAWPRVTRLVHRRHGRMLVFAAVVVLVNVPLYWFRADAATRYFMPMFPTLAAIAAMVFDTLVAQVRETPRGAVRFIHGAALVLLAATAALAGAAVVLSVPGLFPAVAGPIIPAPAMAVLGAAVLAGLGYLLWQHWSRLPVVTFVTLLGFGIVMRVFEIGYRIPYEAQRIVHEHDDVPAILADIRERLPAGVTRVQAVGEMPHALWFYDRDGLVVPWVHYQRDGEPASAYLLVWSVHRERLDALERPVEPVERIAYADGDFILARLGPPRQE